MPRRSTCLFVDTTKTDFPAVSPGPATPSLIERPLRDQLNQRPRLPVTLTGDRDRPAADSSPLAETATSAEMRLQNVQAGRASTGVQHACATNQPTMTQHASPKPPGQSTIRSKLPKGCHTGQDATVLLTCDDLNDILHSRSPRQVNQVITPRDTLIVLASIGVPALSVITRYCTRGDLRAVIVGHRCDWTPDRVAAMIDGHVAVPVCIWKARPAFGRFEMVVQHEVPSLTVKPRKVKKARS